MFSNYGPLSTQIYTLTKPIGKSINGDIEYYFSRLSNTSGKILEAGVGSGRMLIPFLQKGLDIEGIDYSKKMLEICKKECLKNKVEAKLYQQDLINLDLPTKYDAIIMPTGSFCLIEQRKNALQTLQNFYNHLNNNGKLILDLEIPFDFLPNTTKSSVFQLDELTGITLENISLEIDWITQKTHSILKYEKWSKGKLLQTELQNFALSWYGIEEFKNILQKIGFSHIHCSASYNHEKAPTNNNEIITFEAIK